MTKTSARLMDVVHDNRSHLWCGPAVISAMTGRTTREVMMLLREASGARAITGVRDAHLKTVLAKLGFGLVESGVCERARPVLRDWVRERAACFSSRPVVLVVEAGPGGWHYVVVQGDSFLDSTTCGRVVSLADAPCLDYPVERWMSFEADLTTCYVPRDLEREDRTLRALRALARKYGFLVERGEEGWRVDAPMIDEAEDPFECWQEVDVFAARERAETYVCILHSMESESLPTAQRVRERAHRLGVRIEREFDCFEVMCETLTPDPFSENTYVSSWRDVEARVAAYEQLLDAQRYGLLHEEKRAA